MNKKLLQIREGSEVIETIVHYPNVMVKVGYYDESGMAYIGVGFSKYNPADKTMVDKLLKVLERREIEHQARVEKKVKLPHFYYAFLDAERKNILKSIEKYTWKPERGVEMATGRAIKHIYDQVRFDEQDLQLIPIIDEDEYLNHKSLIMDALSMGGVIHGED